MNRHFSRILTAASLLVAGLPGVAGASPALAQANPWGSGAGSAPSRPGWQGSGSLSFPVQGVLCDSSVSVCFNANGAALAETEQEFGRRARRSLENRLINNPIVEVTFADGRYCNFSQRGCWTSRQRLRYDPRLNPWLFGNGAAGPGGQGTVIGGTGSSWGPGSGINPGERPDNRFRPPFTRTRQSGTCTWTNAGISIYNGTCRYEIVQNNGNGARTLVFNFDRLPISNPLRTLRFTAQGKDPWNIQLPNGATAPVQSRVNAERYRTDLQLGWSDVFNLAFSSTNQASTEQLNQTLQPVDANGQLIQGSTSEGLGPSFGGLLQQLFGAP